MVLTIANKREANPFKFSVGCTLVSYGHTYKHIASLKAYCSRRISFMANQLICIIAVKYLEASQVLAATSDALDTLNGKIMDHNRFHTIFHNAHSM